MERNHLIAWPPQSPRARPRSTTTLFSLDYPSHDSLSDWKREDRHCCRAFHYRSPRIPPTNPSAMTHRVWAIFVEAHGQDKIRGMSLDAPSALMLQSRRHEFTVNSERNFRCARKRSPLVNFARRLTVLIDELTGRSYWARYHDCQREDGRRLRRIGAAPPPPTP